MIKKWNQTAGKPANPGFLLEVMALEIFVPDFSGGYPYELKRVFATAADRVKEDVGRSSKAWAPGLGPDGGAKASVARGALLSAGESVTRAIGLAKDGRRGDALQDWRKTLRTALPTS